MESKREALIIMRVMSLATPALFALACFAEQNFPMSRETSACQSGYPDAIRSDPSLWYGIAKLLMLVGVVAGVLGVMLICRSRRSGCNALAACAPELQKSGDKYGHAYALINPAADSFIYFFTTPAGPAHPAMVKITIHPMVDPRHPRHDDIEAFGAYAGKANDFSAWSYRIGREFGRGFGEALMKK